MKIEWRSTRRVLAVNATCAAVLIGFGAFATAQVPSSGAEQQLALLRQQVSTLEKRVTELEKSKGSVARIEEPARPANESAGTKALERRLAALEQAQSTKESALGQGKPITVTAPFVVVDRAGKVVMRVALEATDKASRGIYVFGFGSDFPVAHVGVMADGVGRLYVTNTREKRAQVQILGGASDIPATVAVFRADGNAYNSLEQQGLMIRNGEGEAIGTITSQSGTGYLALSDSSGNTMMDAGTLKSQKGYVRVNPNRASTSPQGDPSVLMGGKR